MLLSLVKLCRMHQWLKNLMLFFPSFLGGVFFSNSINCFHMMLPFTAFCLISSSSYILNDVFDRDNDRYHPDKCLRPISSGQVTIALALFISAILLICSVILALFSSRSFLMYMMFYYIISVCYSIKLKDIMGIDMLCIASGFLLRLQAGGVAFNVAISNWLFLNVFLLSIFLSAGKRLGEKRRLGEIVAEHRKVLAIYPTRLLEGVMYMSGGMVLVTYSIYVTTRNSFVLLYSIPLCCFGLYRYTMRVLSGQSGDPTESLLNDITLLIVGATWVSLMSWGIYGQQ